MDEKEQEQVNDIIDDYERKLQDKDTKINTANQGLASNTFYNQQDSNLIEFQLELDNILEKIEHLLRGDVIKENTETGELGYYPPDDEDLKVLNDYGVQMIMNVISFYLNRNTILSFYDSERIQRILTDLGEELADVIFTNYEKMGMDSEAKKSRYPMLVLNIIHIVESSYRRALEGGEKESLRTARVVTQSEGMRALQRPQLQSSQHKFNIFNPKSW